MFEILEQSTPQCLAVRFSGKVTGQEYLQFLDAIRERLKVNEIVGLVCELDDFSFYGDFEAFKQDLKFGIGEYKHIDKAAFVGDQKWVEWFTRIIGPFSKTEEQYFRHDQFNEAFDWAND